MGHSRGFTQLSWESGDIMGYMISPPGKLTLCELEHHKVQYNFLSAKGNKKNLKVNQNKRVSNRTKNYD